jgi:3-phenylpropionate/trans-cinnamate dioxygenase ferredoxin reductase subunit
MKAESRERLVIVGGGHAAAQLCSSLAEQSYTGHVTLVSEESHLPYHRPPLSKTFLKDEAPQVALLRAQAWYAMAGVDLKLSIRAVRIDRQNQQLELADGCCLPYDKLVLATGARNRCLPESMGRSYGLRTMDDAQALRQALPDAQCVAVVGAGYVGLELACSLRDLGKQVHVFDIAPRILARTASPELSDYLLAWHRNKGIAFYLGVEASSLEQAIEKVHPDLLIAGIGAMPNDELAQAAGVAVANGIVVNPMLNSVSDARIFALGDCARIQYADDCSQRLESVQNANDQARCLAKNLASGECNAYESTPWFWSDQGAVRLQIAGVCNAAVSRRYLRAGVDAEHFSLIHYEGDDIVAVESINSPLDHIAARKIIANKTRISPEQACDASLALKSFL